MNLGDPSGEQVIEGVIAAGVVGVCIAATPLLLHYIDKTIDSGIELYKSATQPKNSAESKAGKITGYTKHGEEQALGRDGGKGVAENAINEAVSNPKEVVEQSGGTIKYVGEKATVVVNRAGQVVTTWANNAAGVRNP